MKESYMPDPEEYPGSSRSVENKKPSYIRKKWLQITILLLVAIFILFIGYATYIISIASHASSRPYSLNILQTDGKSHTNILILGIGNPGHAGEKLSDTILVLSINQTTNHVLQVSIPRDLRIRTEEYGAVKINQVNALGGSELARTAVEQILGLSIQYSVTTDFNGLKDLVDAMGGIDVNVKDELRDSEYPCSDDENRSCGLTITSGQHHMDGSLALQYARCRKGTCGNDFGRAARQQEVVDLIVMKAGKPSIVFHPVEIAKITTAVKSNMTTNLSGLDILNLVGTIRNAKNEIVHFVLSDESGGLLIDANGSTDLLPVGGNYNLIRAKVSELLDK